MKLINVIASLVSLGGVTSAGRLHAAHHGLLQISPSFSGDGVSMYPALHPSHDAMDLNHLIPQLNGDLYFSQEGHRPALHGAKHAQMRASYTRPTVTLEHSSLIEEVSCSDSQIRVCFASHEALELAETSWKRNTDADSFNLITYHIGCGHLTGEYRSFFRASRPVFQDKCVTVAAELLHERDAIHGGEISWGTYIDRHITKRQPVKGHVRAVRSDREVEKSKKNTVNLNTNPQAVKDFFTTNHIRTDAPSSKVQPINSLAAEKGKGLSKRWNPINWVVDGINWVINKARNFINTTFTVIKGLFQAVVVAAALTVKFMMVPFGYPFDEAYHNDIVFDHSIGSKGIKIGTGLGKILSGVSSGVQVAGSSGSASLQCVSCGAKGNFTFDGKLQFNMQKGIQRAEIAFDNNDPFVLDLILQLKAEGTKTPTKLTKTKPIVRVPLSPLAIPGILTVGPYVSVDVALSVSLEAKGTLIAGARFQLEPGRIAFNATDNTKTVARGFKPSLEPVFNLQGSVAATADLGIPVGVQVGIEVLQGTYETSLGIFTTPSIYFTGEISHGEGKYCNDGVELKVGSKIKTHVSIFKVKEIPIDSLGKTFFEKSLGCLTKDGWKSPPSKKRSQEQTSADGEKLFAKVSKSLGGKLPSQEIGKAAKPEVIFKEDQNYQQAKEAKKGQDNGKLVPLPKTQGFRLVQDADRTTTLVSGTDGGLYMVDNKGDYDMSAPWGSLDVSKDIFNYDVFGRLLYANVSRIANKMRLPVRMIEVGVASADYMPKGVRAAPLSLVKKNDRSELFAFALNVTSPHSGKTTEQTWYPTVCRARKGLRLYVARYLINSEGAASLDEEETKHNSAVGAAIAGPRAYKLDRIDLGLDKKNTKVCRTVKLVTHLKAAAQKK